MGDSEDEFDRQRREKFRRERSDIYDRRADRDWSHDRQRGWNSGGPERSAVRPLPSLSAGHRSDYSGQPPQDMKRRFSPGRREEEMSASRKRMRGFEQGFGGDWRPGHGWEPRRSSFRPADEWVQSGISLDSNKLTAHMLTFKQWLSGQPDDISDQEAIKNYSDYKISFKRQQLQQFFVSHKEEEWFKEKYHPVESGRRRIEHENNVKLRAETFKVLVEKGLLNVSLDLSNEDKIVRLLDTAVIFLEGGTEENLKILDDATDAAKLDFCEKTFGDELKTGNLRDVEDFVDNIESKKQAELFKQLVDDSKNLKESDGHTKKQLEKKLHEKGDDSGPSDNSDSDNSIKDDGEKNAEVPISKSEVELPVISDNQKMLHQTYSIFMRSLPPSITRNDIINLCKKFSGFMRVAFSQPIEDHNRFIRRCWVTFERSVNIKDICWNLNNIRLREMELNPVVNRDLARRVRPISGIAQHRGCARMDMKNVVRLILHLDKKMKLWQNVDDITKDAPGTSEHSKTDIQLNADPKNPWLASISEFLVDESSAEEDELLGPEVELEAHQKGSEVDSSQFMNIQRDEELVKRLDLLLYYLRIVHSVDYYNASQYPNEDEMPNRCGIIHARGPVPPNKLTRDDVNEFQKRFAEKLVPILTFKDYLTSPEAAKLGLKDEEKEVEKFVCSNTQELGKDKWLCPLSGKKFKGPDYVRKHIFNKHADKVDAVKKEVTYYNNYLMDPCRPGPPEGQPGAILGQGLGSHLPGFGPFGARPPIYGEPFGQFSSPQYRHRVPPAPYAGVKTYPPKQREIRPREPYAGRPVIEYRDLDAPDDADFF